MSEININIVNYQTMLSKIINIQTNLIKTKYLKDK
jgi:hypothetical protein